MDNSQLDSDSSTSRVFNSLTYSGEHQYSRPSGLQVYVTETGVFPNENTQSLTASAGMYTKEVVSMVARRKLKVSDRQCSQQPTFVSFIDPLNDTHTQNYKLTPDLCRYRLKLLLHHKKCGCLPHQARNITLSEFDALVLEQNSQKFSLREGFS